MSYDLFLVDPVTKKTIDTGIKHEYRGGTFCCTETRLWLNVTYNYSHIFQRVLGPNGIYAIRGLTGAQSIPLLQDAAAKLESDVHSDYWAATEGNVQRALKTLVELAKLGPDGVWTIS